jgi:elongation factor G
MNNLTPATIRNVAILGHQGSGKTSLVESLYAMINQVEKGSVEKKNTVSDYTKEEKARLSSVSTAIIPLEYKDHKINLLDIPGNDDFIWEALSVTHSVKGAVLVIDAGAGVEPGTERAWEELRKHNIPTLIFVNKMDKENIKYEELIEELKEKFGKRVAPFAYPLGKLDKFDGFALVAEGKARLYRDGICVDGEIYDDKKDKVQELYDWMCEAVAETSEELMEKYFAGEPLELEEVKAGLRTAVLAGEVYPVICGSAAKNIGVATLLNMIIDYNPCPDDLKPKAGHLPGSDQEVLKPTKDSEPFADDFETVPEGVAPDIEAGLMMMVPPPSPQSGSSLLNISRVV